MLVLIPRAELVGGPRYGSRRHRFRRRLTSTGPPNRRSESALAQQRDEVIAASAAELRSRLAGTPTLVAVLTLLSIATAPRSTSSRSTDERCGIVRCCRAHAAVGPS